MCRERCIDEEVLGVKVRPGPVPVGSLAVRCREEQVPVAEVGTAAGNLAVKAVHREQPSAVQAVVDRVRIEPPAASKLGEPECPDEAVERRWPRSGCPAVGDPERAVDDLHYVLGSDPTHGSGGSPLVSGPLPSKGRRSPDAHLRVVGHCRLLREARAPLWSWRAAGRGRRSGGPCEVNGSADAALGRSCCPPRRLGHPAVRRGTLLEAILGRLLVEMRGRQPRRGTRCGRRGSRVHGPGGHRGKQQEDRPSGRSDRGAATHGISFGPWRA